MKSKGPLGKTLKTYLPINWKNLEVDKFLYTYDLPKNIKN
jgi:hypothetical protein